MHHKGRFPDAFFGASLRPNSAAFAVMILLVLLFLTVTAQPARAQSYKVIHTFTGGLDGASPSAGLTMDAFGNLYGTTGYGARCGTVFKLTHTNFDWVFTPLYIFQGGTDGCDPWARVIFGPDGNLYGTTRGGGSGGAGCGTVFELSPPAQPPSNVMSGWIETLLYRFRGAPDGCDPDFSPVSFDSGGNIYLTTVEGGDQLNGGAVVKLVPYHGGWTESVIYSFPYDGSPESGVILDKLGNLYGTLQHNSGAGAVFQLVPSESGWIENVLYSFHAGGDGANPEGGLLFDQSGNLYGTTDSFGVGGGGTVFELTPSNGEWVFSLLYSLVGSPYVGPYDSLIMDSFGNLYGTTYGGGAYGYGSVFELTPTQTGWTYRSLHDFTLGNGGSNPMGSVMLAPNGKFYGTTWLGGNLSCGGGAGCGVVFEITP
jgi:uncharacterized repeat protein (TIGR03803 family)